MPRKKELRRNKFIGPIRANLEADDEPGIPRLVGEQAYLGKLLGDFFLQFLGDFGITFGWNQSDRLSHFDSQINVRPKIVR